MVPVIAAGSAGGTGSALLVLLADALHDREFKNRLTHGLPPNFVRKPIAFVADPYVHADLHDDELHKNRLFGNAQATRIAIGKLQERNAYKYVFYHGLANEEGTVLDSLDDVYQTLGRAIYEFERNWQDIKALLVNTVDNHAIRGRYTGNDTMEAMLLENGNGELAPAIGSGI